MAGLTWIEDGESRQATIVRLGKKATSTYTKSWKVFGTNDDVALHAAAAAYIANGNQYWQYPNDPGMRLMFEQLSVSYLGDDAWQVTAHYEKNGAEDGTEPLKRARSFDTTGGTQHITQGFSESRFGANAPNQQKAIAVDSNGVNGVDVVTPQLQWQESYDVPSNYVTSAYIRNVSGMTGTTNNAPFRGFELGEVLFLGCSGNQEWDDQKGKGPWSLSYRFIASQNVTDQTIGDIAGISKMGHQYLWVRYQDAVDESVLFKKPKHVYVNSVYKETNFAALGIGTG